MPNYFSPYSQAQRMYDSLLPEDFEYHIDDEEHDEDCEDWEDEDE